MIERISYKLHRIRKAAVRIFCLAVVLTGICSMTVFATEPRTIRVGYFSFIVMEEVVKTIARNINGQQLPVV